MARAPPPPPPRRPAGGAPAGVAQAGTGPRPVAAPNPSGSGGGGAAATPDRAPLPKAGGADIIKTAAAGPREVAMRQSPPGVGASKSDAADEEQPHRTGPAMLIAALAVMTAIALRRSGGSGQ